MEKALKRLVELFSSSEESIPDMEVLDADETNAEAIISAAETLPFFAKRRLVIVRNVDRLRQSEQKKLSAYLERPNETTILVLIAHFPLSGGTRESRASVKKTENSIIFKKARQAGEVVKYSLGAGYDDQNLQAWVVREFAKRGKKISPSAVKLLIEKIGSNLRELEGAIDRLSFLEEERREIEVKQVNETVKASAQEDIFELVDSVADRRRDVALYLLERILKQGESPERIFSLLLRQFRLIAKAKSLSSEKSDISQIAQVLGIPGFLAAKAVKQSRKFSTDRLRDIICDFRDCQEEMHETRFLPEGDYMAFVLDILVSRIVG